MSSLPESVRTSPCPDRSLVVAARGGGRPAEQARRVVLERYRPLVLSMASRFAAHGRSRRDDLVSTGHEGLLKAMRDFDLDRGVPFAAYARAKVHGEMLRWLRDTRYAVHVPRTLHETFMQVRRAEGDLESSLQRSPTVAEIGAAVGIDEDTVVAALAVGSADRARTATLARALDDADPQRWPDVDLSRALARLPARSRLVLHRRYWVGATQQEVAVEIGVSQAQVSRIESRAVADLHALLADDQLAR